eukprot:783592_1
MFATTFLIAISVINIPVSICGYVVYERLIDVHCPGFRCSGTHDTFYAFDVCYPGMSGWDSNTFPVILNYAPYDSWNLMFSFINETHVLSSEFSDINCTDLYKSITVTLDKCYKYWADSIYYRISYTETCD